MKALAALSARRAATLAAWVLAAWVLAAWVLAALLAPAARAQQQEPGGAQDSSQPVRIVAPSDSLVQTTTDDGTRVQTLIGNVRLRQGTTRLRADRATRYRAQEEIFFTGDVLIIDEGDSLWADRVRYDSRRKVGRANGTVRVSSGGEVLLAGPEGRYFFDEKHAVFPRRVTLVDSARVLKSRSGEYFSREERAEFYRDVRVFSDSTYLEADSVTYLRRNEVTKARGNVFIERRGDRAASGEAGPDAPQNVGARPKSTRSRALTAQRAAPDTSVATRPDTTRLDTTRPDTLAARARRPQLLGRALPVDTTRRALLPDTTARTLLWGERAYNDPRDGYSRVTGRALLVRLQPPDSSETNTSESTGPDSAAAPAPPRSRARGAGNSATPDTLIIRGRQLETTRSDTLRRLTATDDVRLWQADLQAVADSAVYDQRPDAGQGGASEGHAPLDPRGLALPDSILAVPDVPASTDRLASADSVATPDSAASAGNAPREAPPPRRESRFFDGPLAWSPGSDGSAGAQLSGDSLRVTGRGGSVRRLFARGSGFLAQEDSVLEDRLQQLKGRRLVGRFAEDAGGQATLRRLSAGPNAEAIYFQKNENADASADSARALAGAVRVSADSIVFRLRGGELHKMRVLSGVEGRRYRAENVPTPFELDGLVWTPDRRPRKEPFLTQERVRRRLVRPEAAQDPPQEPETEPPPAETPPTTAASSNAPDDPGDG